MPWGNGGVIGTRNLATATSASGVWRMSEVDAARRGAAWPTMSDPLFSSVSLLMHFENALADSSGTPKTFTAVGNAQTSTAQSAFGAGSLVLDGSGDRIESVGNAAYALSTGDFTVELFVRFAAVPTVQGSFVNVNGAGGFSFYHNGSSGAFFGKPANSLVVSNRSADQLVASWAPAANVWYHLAATRASGSLKVFVDGVQVGNTATSNTTNFSQAAIQIGGASDGSSWTINGNIDELRITKGAAGSGAARYTSNFIRPAAAFQDS